VGLPVLIEVRIFIKTARARQQNVIRHKIGLLNLATENWATSQKLAR
jgi:homoserine trans-succinylase